MSRDVTVYLAQILDAIERIGRYTAGGRQPFFDEQLIQDAVLRNLEVIGEAAKRVPNDFRAAHPGVRWRGMAALRDVLIHQYDAVDLQRVWDVIEQELATVESGIRPLVPPEE